MADRLAEIVGHISSITSRYDLFNQYRDKTAADLDNAPESRCNNLLQYLTSFQSIPSTLILAEAPGPWGCRYTGIPITSEEHLVDETFPIDAVPCTTGPVTPEYSARIFWRVLQPYYNEFVVWNAVPFHPHRADNIDSIRTPRASELTEFASLTKRILEYYEPHTVLALGRRPEKQLKQLGVEATYVRHPSQGGATLFEQSMLKIFTGDPARDS